MDTSLRKANTAIINQRKSVRTFLSKPVPKSILSDVFELSLRAPSNCNTQPWQVYVSSGNVI